MGGLILLVINITLITKKLPHLWLPFSPQPLLSLQCSVECISLCGTCSGSYPIFSTFALMVAQVVVLQLWVVAPAPTLCSIVFATTLINVYSVGCKLLEASSDLGRHMW